MSELEEIDLKYEKELVVQLIDKWLEGWSQKDVDVILKYVSSDVVAQLPNMPSINGSEKLKEFFFTYYNKRPLGPVIHSKSLVDVSETGDVAYEIAYARAPHALMIVFKDQVMAWKAYDDVMPPEVPRIILVDTYLDEKVEATMAVEALGEGIQAIRLDTPETRRGDFSGIIREVRWEMDLRGHEDVGIFVSGGLDEEAVRQLGDAGANGFGVGTYVSCAPPVDFAMDIVEVEGRPAAKRGKLSGRKQVWRCPKCMTYVTKPYTSQPLRCPRCGSSMEKILRPLIKNGEIVADLKDPREIREKVRIQIDKLHRVSEKEFDT